MKLKIIYGWLPVGEENSLEILSDYADLLTEYNFNYFKTLQGIEADGFEYFRTHNPTFVDCLDINYILENVLIWNGTELKKFKESPELLEKSMYLSPGDLLSGGDFSKNWKEK